MDIYRTMKFLCVVCKKEHDSFPSWGADRPADYWDVPPERREEDVFLTSDSCVIAGQFFFIRGCLEIPIIGSTETYTWGVWVSLSESNFFIWQTNYNASKRSHIGPFFGWLCSSISVYPDTRRLKTMVHLRDKSLRPLIELDATDHPLSVHQRFGISIGELSAMMHELEEKNRP
jgi:hypothetical protein